MISRINYKGSGFFYVISFPQQVLINVLKNSEDRKARRITIGILGDIRDQSAIPAIEEALNDRDRNVRSRAVDALIVLGNSDSLVRLKDYLNNNMGNVVNVEYDTAKLELIKKRLQSGKRGLVTYDEIEGLK